MHGPMHGPHTSSIPLLLVVYALYTRIWVILEVLSLVQSGLARITSRTDWIDRLIFGLAIRRLIDYGLDA